MTRGEAALRAGRRAARTLFLSLAALGKARVRPPDGVRGRAEALRDVAAEMVAIHDLRIGVHGSWPSGPVILVCNHVSYLDPVVIASRHPCVAISKGEVADWPVLGPAGRGLGVLFVDRSSPHDGARVLRRSLAALRVGVSVLNFPEGTTTDGSHLLPFRRGIFGLARIAGVPVLPIALTCGSPDLTWTGGATFVPHYLRTAARRSSSVELELGELIDPARFSSADELAVITHHRIARMLRGSEHHHEPAIRARVPAARPDAVLPPAGRRLAAGL